MPALCQAYNDWVDLRPINIDSEVVIVTIILLKLEKHDFGDLVFASCSLNFNVLFVIKVYWFQQVYKIYKNIVMSLFKEFV